MRLRWVLGVGVVMVLALVVSVPAPIHGGFPGWDELIERSEAVVVAEITATPQERRMRASGGEYNPAWGTSGGDHEDHDVIILRRLKCDLPMGRAQVISLRPLPLRDFVAAREAPEVALAMDNQGRWFPRGSVHLLFLESGTQTMRHWAEGPVATWSNLNTSGSNVMLAPGTDLTVAEGASAEVAVAALLEASRVEWERTANDANGRE